LSPRAKLDPSALSLRVALRDVVARGLVVCAGFERLGCDRPTRERLALLDAIDRGEAVTVNADQLASALDALGAPLQVIRDALGFDHWHMESSGAYTPEV
jgi:hypothetical protein